MDAEKLNGVGTRGNSDTAVAETEREAERATAELEETGDISA